jgi:hypothetical protein
MLAISSYSRFVSFVMGTPRKPLRNILKASVLYLICSCFSTCACRGPNQAAVPPTLVDSPKGLWGRVTPIADGNHPNLYYNETELQELRNMILVQHGPKHLYDLYHNTIKRYELAVTADDPGASGNNWAAALSYAIEPTSTKADRVRTALLSFMLKYPSGLPDWFTPSSFSGYSLPWMFDLIQAYHPDKLSSVDKANLKQWFALSAERLKFDSRDSFAVSGPSDKRETWVAPVIRREGKTMVAFPNWYSRYMGPALACALVSGNQADVDYWADSGWPHNLFTFDGVTNSHPSDTANRYDLVMYLLAVYPSGANTDTYDREGYRLSESDWNTASYTATYQNPVDGGSYHWAQMSGAILGAEMAYHNGMTGVFGITDVAGTEPALLRTFKRAIQSRTELDRRPTSKTGHPFIGYSQWIWPGYRRYSDPTIEAALPAIGTDLSTRPDVPNVVLEFFGYPRLIVIWQTPPPPTVTPTRSK